MSNTLMYDVLERLRELDKKNPNVHSDALENTEKMNAPIEEAKKKAKSAIGQGKKATDAPHKVSSKGKEGMGISSDELTVAAAQVAKGQMKSEDSVEMCSKECCGKPVTECKCGPDCEHCDCYEKNKAMKENISEAIQVVVDSPEDLSDLAKIMQLAGLKTVTPDMMPGADNVPVMKGDNDVSCGCGGDAEYDNSPNEQYSEVDAVTTNAGIEGLNGKKAPQDIRVKDPNPYEDFKIGRLKDLAGIESDEDSVQEDELPKSLKVLKLVTADIKKLKAEKDLMAKQGYDEDVEMIERRLSDLYQIAELVKDGGYIAGVDTAVADDIVDYYEKAGEPLPFAAEEVEAKESIIEDEGNKQLSAWYDKYSQYDNADIGGLADGMFKFYMDSGVDLDAIEKSEYNKLVKKYGEDEIMGDALRHLDEMPITKAMFDEFEKIMGEPADEESAKKAVSMLGLDENTKELNRIRKNAGINGGIDEEWDNEPEELYKGYDADEYANNAGGASRKTHQVPARSGDNPLEGLEDHLRQAYEEFMAESELSKPEAKEKERIFKGMKKAKSDFKDRYGDRGEEVMHATATKLAKKRK